MGIVGEFEDALTRVFTKFGFRAYDPLNPAEPYPGENATSFRGYDPTGDMGGDTDPIPVLVTKLPASELQAVVPIGARQFTTQHFVLGTVPQQIGGYNKRRRSITIVNKGTTNVAIDSGLNVKLAGAGNPNGSAELYPGDAITMETSAEVYAIGSATLADVMVWQLMDEGGSNQ